MVNTNDILARLQAGETADAIAQELVDALNKANAQYAEEQAAAQKANDIHAHKAAMIQDMANIVVAYVDEFHPDSIIAEMIHDQELDVDGVIEMLDASFDQLDQEVRKMKQFEKMLGGILAKLDIDHECGPDCGCADKPVGKIEPNMDALAAFLKANGLS